MLELDGSADLNGVLYKFEGIVEHAFGGRQIVLCRDEEDSLRYLSPDEWAAASRPSSGGMDPKVGDVPHGDAIVSHESPWNEKVALVMSLFRGRMDVYAEGYFGRETKDGKLSYWPPCKLRWIRGACPKLANPKARCSECNHPSYLPLTSDVVSKHCKGQRDARGRIQAIGIYVVDGDVCYLLAADFDGPGWQDAAAAYRDACRAHGLSPAVERSRSGNGAHVWVFFDGAVKAALARRVGEGLVSEARDTCTAVSFRSYDRLFPLQDSVGPGDLGSLIALPLQGESVREGKSVFVDDQFQMLPDQCAYLSVLPKASPAHIAALAEEFGKDPIGLPDGASGRIAPPKQKVMSSTVGAEPSPGGPSLAVQVTLSDGVRIKCDALPAHVINRLRRLAAFRNPEFAKKLRMHFSVRDIPRLIDLSTLDEGEVVLPRGCMEAALNVLREEGIEPFVADGRTEGRHIRVRFLGELRTIQEPCRDKLVNHDMGVLVAPTGFGKSVIASSIIATHQVNTLVIVPNTALLLQWRESLAKFLQIDEEAPVLLTPKGRKRKHQPGTVGIVGGGSNLRSGIVDVALAGSLYEKGEASGDTVVSSFVGEYGMVIVDEAQHVAAAKVLEVLGAVRAHCVYAMTATPKRDDGLDRILYLECGPLRHEVAVADQMEEQGMRRLLVPRLSCARPDLEIASTWHALVDYISVSEERNHLIVTDAIRAINCGRTPLVLTRRVEHARTLARLIDASSNSANASVVLLIGSDDDVVRKQRLVELHAAPLDQPLCVVATGSYVGEGFDLDRLDTLLLAGPVAFEGALAQWVGRLHRVREGKTEVVVMDYVDPAIPMFEREWRSRVKVYSKLGYEMVGEDELTLVGLDMQNTPIGHLFAGNEFVKSFDSDLSGCQTKAVIASSWARFSRVKVLCDLLSDLVRRGVSVDIVLRKPTKQSAEWQQVLTTLRDHGCQVRLASKDVVIDCAVLDGSLVWFGGAAPLAYPRRDDCSLRLVSGEVAHELLETLGLESSPSQE